MTTPNQIQPAKPLGFSPMASYNFSRGLEKKSKNVWTPLLSPLKTAGTIFLMLLIFVINYVFDRKHL
jgi:hypothetical protein